MPTIKTSIPSNHEHPFAQYVRILGKGKKGTRSLTEAEAYQAMTMIMANEVEDVQLGAFLMLLRVKEETPEELLGFVKAVRDTLNYSADTQFDLDWSSYAGKRRHLPWYLCSIFLLAQAGIKVFIHGASGHTIDRIYTEQVLRALGFSISTNWQDCDTAVTSQGFCYFPLQHLSPPLHRIIDLRNTLGLRSPVHTLARLLNPTNATAVIQGIFHPAYQPVHQSAALQLGYQKVAVIKGEAGEIERNPDVNCLVKSVVNGEFKESLWPAMFSKRHIKEKSLDMEKLIGVWRGTVQDEYGQAAILGTAAIALELLNDSLTQQQALEQAEDLWNQRNKSLI